MITPLPKLERWHYGNILKGLMGFANRARHDRDQLCGAIFDHADLSFEIGKF